MANDILANIAAQRAAAASARATLGGGTTSPGRAAAREARISYTDPSKLFQFGGETYTEAEIKGMPTPASVPKAAPETVEQLLQKSQDWGKYPPTMRERQQVSMATGYKWDPFGRQWKAPTGYGRIMAEQRYQPISSRYSDYGAQKQYDRIMAEQRAIERAAETWPKKIGHGLGYKQVGGVRTALEIIEQPFLAYKKTRKRKRLSEPTYFWSKDFQADVRSQYQRLSEKWREERVASASLRFYEPERWVQQEVAGIALTSAALLLPEYLPSATAAFAARAPAGFVSLAKVPVGAGVAGFGTKILAETLPKVKEEEPGSLLELIGGVSLIGVGASTAISGASRWLRWRGESLTGPPAKFQLTGLEAKKYEAEAAFGKKLKTVGEVPVKIKETFLPKKYDYTTHEVRGVEISPYQKKERTGLLLETSTQHKGGVIEYGEMVGGKWQTTGRGVIARKTVEGTEFFAIRPIEHASYPGLPKKIKSFDVIGFYGGELKIPGRRVLDTGTMIFETSPTLMQVQKTSVSEGAFTSLIETHPEKMIRISGLKSYVGVTEVAGAPGFLDVMPEGAEARGIISLRFVEGPKEYVGTKVTPMTAAQKEAASVSQAMKRAFGFEGGLEGAVFKFELEQAGVSTIGVGEGLVVGGAAAKGTQTAVISGGATYVSKPAYVSVPLYTSRVLAPGEPSVLDVLPTATGLTAGLGLITGLKIDKAPPPQKFGTFSIGKVKAESVIKTRPRPRIEPRVQPFVKPITRVEPTTRTRPTTRPIVKPRVKPRVKPKVEPRVQPRVKTLVRPRVRPRTVPKPRPRQTFTYVPGGRPQRQVRRRVSAPRRPRMVGRRGRKKVFVIKPKADYPSLTFEELRTGRKAKHPPATRVITRAFIREMQQPGAAAFRFPTAGELKRSMKGQTTRPRKTKTRKRKSRFI